MELLEELDSLLGLLFELLEELDRSQVLLELLLLDRSQVLLDADELLLDELVDPTTAAANKSPTGKPFSQ